jgi:hypothetical protein
MIRADMIGLRQISASRLLAAALLAIGCALMLAPAPATAQEEQQTPWYMPQAWVTPPQTGPKVRPLPGYYGSIRYNHSTYGSFSTSCYGECGYLRGTIVTGNGVVLRRPTAAIYDRSVYQLVPRGYYPTRYVYVRTPMPRPVMVAQRSAHPATPVHKKVLSQYTIQNGVRIIRPAPPPTN